MRACARVRLHVRPFWRRGMPPLLLCRCSGLRSGRPRLTRDRLPRRCRPQRRRSAGPPPRVDPVGTMRPHAARTPQSEIVVYSCFFETCVRAFMYGVALMIVCVLYAKIHAQQRFCADHRSRPATRTTEKRGNRNVLRCFGERCLSYIHASFFKDFDHNGPQSPKNFLASRGGRSQVVKNFACGTQTHFSHIKLFLMHLLGARLDWNNSSRDQAVWCYSAGTR